MSSRHRATMGRRPVLGLLASLGACAALPAARASARTLSWETRVNGVRTLLELTVEGTQATGSLEEGGVTLPVQGTLQAQRLQAEARHPGTGQRVLTLDGRLQGDDLVLAVRTVEGQGGTVTLRRVGAPAAPAPAADAASARLEPAFVGRWHSESQINSSGGAGGFASFSTVRTLELGEDGRIRQWVRSAGGGGNWSHAGGQTLEFSGRWQVRGSELWVAPDGQGGFERAGVIRRAGEFLVTEVGGRRTNWRR